MAFSCISYTYIVSNRQHSNAILKTKKRELDTLFFVILSLVTRHRIFQVVVYLKDSTSTARLNDCDDMLYAIDIILLDILPIRFHLRQTVFLKI